MKIQRGYRHSGDFDSPGDFLIAVENHSCRGCIHGDPDGEFPSTGCPVAARAFDGDGIEIGEWSEVQAPTLGDDGLIACSARIPKG